MSEQYWLRLPTRLVGPLDRAKAEELLRDGHVEADTPTCTDQAFQSAGRNPDAVRYVPLRAMLSRARGQTRKLAPGRTGQTRTIAKPGAGANKPTTRRVAPTQGTAAPVAETMAFEAEVPAAPQRASTPADIGATIEAAPTRRVGKQRPSQHDYYFAEDEEDDIYDDPADEEPPMSADQLSFSDADANANVGDPTNASHGQHGTIVRTATAAELPPPRDPVSVKTMVTYGLYGVGLIVIVIGIVLTFNLVSDLNKSDEDDRGGGSGLALNPAGTTGGNDASANNTGNSGDTHNDNEGNATSNSGNAASSAGNNAASNASNSVRNTPVNNTATNTPAANVNRANTSNGNNASNGNGASDNTAENAADNDANDPAAQRRAQDIARAVSEVETALDQSLPGTARSRLRALRALDPEHPRLDWYSALSAYSHELHAEAFTESLALVTADPTDLEAWTLRAMVLAYRFDAGGIQEVLSAVESLDRNAATAIAAIALTHMREHHTALPFLEAALALVADAPNWPEILHEQVLLCAFDAGVATLHRGLLRTVAERLERDAFDTMAGAVLSGSIALAQVPIDTDAASRAAGTLRGIGPGIPKGRVWRHAQRIAARVPARAIEIVARWEAYRGSAANYGIAMQRAAALSDELHDAFVEARVWLEPGQVRQMFQLAQRSYQAAERADIESRTAAFAVRYYDVVPIFTREPEQMLERALGSDPSNVRLAIRSCGRTAHNGDAPAALRSIEPLMEKLPPAYPYTAPVDDQLSWLLANPYAGALRAEAYMTLCEIHMHRDDDRDARRALEVVLAELLAMPYRTQLLRRVFDASIAVEGLRKTDDHAEELIERMDEFQLAPSRSRSDLLRVRLLSNAQQKKFSQGERLVRDTIEVYANCWYGGVLLHEIYALSALLAIEDWELADAEAALQEMGNAELRRADAIADLVRVALTINAGEVNELRALTRGFSSKYQLDGDRTLFEIWTHLLAGSITNAQFEDYISPFTPPEAVAYLEEVAAGIRVRAVNRTEDFHAHVLVALETPQNDAPILYNFLKEYADEQDID